MEKPEIVLINNNAQVFSTALLISSEADVDLGLFKYNYPISKDENGDYVVDESSDRGVDGNIVSNSQIVLDDNVFCATSVIHTGEVVEDIKDFNDGKYDWYYFDIQKKFYDKLATEWARTNLDDYRERGFKDSIIEYFHSNLESCTLHYDFLAALLKQDKPLDYFYRKSRELTFKKVDFIEVNEDGQIIAYCDLMYIGEMAYMENYRAELDNRIDGYTYFARKPCNYDDVKSYSIAGSRSQYSKRLPYRIVETVSFEDKEYTEYVNGMLLDSMGFIDKLKDNLVDSASGIWQCIKLQNKDNPEESILIHPSGYDYARYVGFEESKLDKLIEADRNKNRDYER